MKKIDQDKSLITFVIPAYNEEKYIADTIRAIKINSPCYPCQIIVVDNGSTDGTAQIVKTEKAVLIKQPKGTIASARNRGALASGGDVLVFLDADMLLTPAWQKEIDSTVDVILKDPLLITGSRCGVQDNNNWILKYWFARMQSEKSNYMNSGHMITSRELFNNIGGFNEELHTAEDYDFCKRAKQSGAKIVNNPKLYVIHTGYPATLKKFIAREKWHGYEDFKNFQSILRSKVALVAIINILLMSSSVLLAVLSSSVLYVSLYFILIFMLAGISTFNKFGFDNLKSFLATSLIFFFYFSGRSLACIDRVKKRLSSGK